MVQVSHALRTAVNRPGVWLFSDSRRDGGELFLRNRVVSEIVSIAAY